MNFDRKTIFCEVEPLPQSDMKRYRLECTADCGHRCTLTFNAQKGQLFVYVEKSVGVFSSLCKRLEKADAEIDRRNGHLSLISDADKEA